MKYTNAFINTRKSVAAEVEAVSHELALKAGLINQLGAGLYSFLPLGLKVIKKIEQVVREEMDAIGGLEVALPIVQPIELWKESGRLDTYGAEMLRFTNRDDREFCFGPTHEEVISHLARDFIASYKQLPITLYQIGRKFRDEKRPRYGLIRCKEFIMKDAYTFDKDEASMQATYDSFKNAYIKIFTRLGLKFAVVAADPGEIGGSVSEEFLAYSSNGEDKFYLDESGEAKKLESLSSTTSAGEAFTGLEIGHIFQLGQTYSKKMNVSFTGADGAEHQAYMGCYGVGISRILASIIDQHHDANGIIWPKEVTPYQAVILPLQKDSIVQEQAAQIQKILNDNHISNIIDDRECSPGIKFKDANLIGVPLKIIISIKNMEKNNIEFEIRRTNEKVIDSIDNMLNVCKKILANDII